MVEDSGVRRRKALLVRDTLTSEEQAERFRAMRRKRQGELVMTQDFQSSLSFVLGAEGGFSNDPADRGGATNFGITQATYSAWLTAHGMADARVKEISEEYAEAIYLENYWNAGACQALPSPLNLIQFDSVVNHGLGGARPMLTSALAFPGATVEQEAFALLALRDNLYRRIVGRDPTQDKFLKGWLNRLDHLRKAAGL